MFLGVLSLGLAHAQQNDPFKGRVGVNTETPSATLNVQSKEDTGKIFELDKITPDPKTKKPVNTKLVTVHNNGYTGILTDKPKEQLHVMGGIRSQRSGDLGGFIDLVNTDKTGTGNEQKVGMWRFYNLSAPNVEGLHLFGYPEDRGTNPFNHTRSVLIIGDNGNVGVGTGNQSAPSERLHLGTGNMRIETLPTNAGADTDKIVVVDNDGVLKSVERSVVIGTGATQLTGEANLACNNDNRGKMNFIKDVALQGGGTADAFAVCLKSSDGQFVWRYLYGGQGVSNQTGNFGDNLNP